MARKQMTQLKCISGLVKGRVQCPYCGYVNPFDEETEKPEEVDILKLFMIGQEFCSVEMDIRSTCGNCKDPYKVKVNIAADQIINNDFGKKC